MNAPVRTWLPWVLGLVLLASLVAWFLATHKREVQTLPLPPRGEASYNPLYALKLTLLAQHMPVNSRQRLQLDQIELAARDTVLIYSDPALLTEDELHTLFAFAEDGGHLILRLPQWQKDATAAPLDDWLPISSRLFKPDCVMLKVTKKDFIGDFCRSPRFKLEKNAQPDAVWQIDHDQVVFARFAYGKGSVDVMSDLVMLANNGLTDAPHQLFAQQLLAPNRGVGTFHLIYAADMPPLWKLLLERAWMAWLPLVLALLAWLWLRAQRFGPWLPSPVQPRRALLEHVDASGEHLLRYGKLTLLHRALRETVLARLRRVDPLIAAQQGDTQARLLAQRLGLHPDTLRAVLDTRPPATPHEFRQRIARLIALRKRL